MRNSETTMRNAADSHYPAQADASIDWTDIQAGVFVGLVFAVIKGASIAMPEWRLGNLDSLIPFLICVEYTIYRARHYPEKLDVWGLTMPITTMAVVVGAAMAAAAIGGLATLGFLLTGSLSFEFIYVPKMIEYLVSAFPQQFFLCSVVLVSLSKIRVFHGQWRLPLVVGVLFALAHFWTPHHIPGTGIPLQLIGTFPLGFLAAWYFLTFRTILPLTVAHAVLYVLLHHWVLMHL